MTIDRGADEDRAWDYNYDTWYYTDTDNKMNLTFSTLRGCKIFLLRDGQGRQHRGQDGQRRQADKLLHAGSEQL